MKLVEILRIFDKNEVMNIWSDKGEYLGSYGEEHTISDAYYNREVIYISPFLKEAPTEYRWSYSPALDVGVKGGKIG